MQDAIVDFGIGILAGGLGLSICWGLFWLVISTIGLVRRACSWRAVLNSVVVGGVPLLLIWGLVWARGSQHGSDAAFTVGLSIMPLILIGLGLRQAPDGQRAGAHMILGVRHLIDELLGGHHACGRCAHEHGPHEAGGHR
jgi:hypothetical protein